MIVWGESGSAGREGGIPWVYRHGSAQPPGHCKKLMAAQRVLGVDPIARTEMLQSCTLSTYPTSCLPSSVYTLYRALYNISTG